MRFLPEIEKIVPLVWEPQAVVFKQRGILLHDGMQALLARRARQLEAVGKLVEIDDILVIFLQAEQEGTNNYFVLPLHKLCPPIMKALLDLGEVKLNGIICPGHVSAVIGSRPYDFIPEDYGIACVVSGFEPLDILLSVDMLVNQIETGQYKVEIAYRRGVKPEGNKQATELIDTVFEVCDANWRGIGEVPASGLRLNEKYKRFDAESNFSIDPGPTREPKGCICGSILRGVSTPLDCQLFRTGCTPEQPIGPCMVSSEGACATYYHYGDSDGG